MHETKIGEVLKKARRERRGRRGFLLFATRKALRIRTGMKVENGRHAESAEGAEDFYCSWATNSRRLKNGKIA
jgi:hypothetical protein